MKRITAFLTAVLMFFVSTTQPARAFAPVAVLGAPQIVTAAGSYGIGALAGLVGLVGLYFTIEDANNNKVRLPLGEKTNNNPPAPSAPGTASITGTPKTEYVCTSGGDWSSSPTAAAQSYIDVGGCDSAYTCTPGTCTETSCQIIRVEKSTGANYNFNVGIMKQTNTGPPYTCPSGYKEQSGTCVLDNSRLVTDDKTCDILYSQGSFGVADDLNCSAQADGTKVMPILRKGKAIAYGKNSSGQPLMWEVNPPTVQNPYFSLRQYEQTQTAIQTQVTTTEVQLDPQTQTVTSVTTSTEQGSLASPTSAQVPTADPVNEPTQADTPQVKPEAKKDITCGLPGTPPCAIDDSGFQNRYVPPATSTYNPDLNKQKDLIENIEPPSIGFGWLPSLLPGDAVACHPLEFRGAVNVGEVNLDSTTQLDLCPYLDIARNIFGWLFGVVSIIYIWRRFAGARGGEN